MLVAGRAVGVNLRPGGEHADCAGVQHPAHGAEHYKLQITNLQMCACWSQVGLRGPISALVENTLTVLACNTLLMVLSTLLPFSLGRAATAALTSALTWLKAFAFLQDVRLHTVFGKVSGVFRGLLRSCMRGSVVICGPVREVLRSFLVFF